MSSNLQNAFEYLRELEGSDQGHGEWFEVDQDRINDFADATIDHQFIHVDPERA
ncbi:MAG: MaoC/PaaZ C-terminal domain-containing protein, partial [Actinomycetota bacterium]|nr:MaoC/PaaZ C-terminal domain-containing protein [Actinomycetota bacterium]